jgi:hypothetical protein
VDSTTPTLGRNDPCHCGSGKKYKHCCLDKDEGAERAKRTDAPEGEQVVQAPAHEKPAPPHPPKRPTTQPWRRGPENRGGVKFNIPRRSGGS